MTESAHKAQSDPHPQKAVTAPDTYPLVFPDEDGLEQCILDVIEGRDYPLFFAPLYQPSTIIDIGGHVGSTARYFAHSYPKAGIVSFEPHPITFQYLQHNAKPYAGRIAPVNAGLGNTQTELELFEGQYSSMQASTIKNEENKDQSVKIFILEAKDAMAKAGVEKIDILKIDTEGMEIPIFQALQTFLPSTDVIYLEYHSEEDRHKLDAMFAQDFTLFHASVMEPDRGMLGYCNKRKLEELRETYKDHPDLPKQYAYNKGASGA